jgi:arginyl-tRNA synthetase
MISIIKEEIKKILLEDITFSCFVLAKEMKKDPKEVAIEVKNKLIGLSASKDKNLNLELIEKIEEVGPYVNFYLNSKKVAEIVIDTIKKDENYGKNELDGGKKVVVEFSQANTHKAFHIGHLRGTITGESVSRILENSGYEVLRVNYQGDVGMQIAKCLWGVLQKQNEYKAVKDKSVEEKVKFLGEVYAYGAQTFEKDENVKQSIIEINDKIYTKHSDIEKIYTETRSWSLEYLDNIYKKLDTHFDRLYFESEVYERGVEIVKEFLSSGVFKESDGAVIFEGSKYDGLHDRVFVNSKGFPTYEAKEMALGELQLKENEPDKIIHVVAKEQIEYFKVVFKALEEIFPETKDKEMHLAYGWVDLKGGKMSSRKGDVVLGEWLMQEVKKKVLDIMKESKIEDKSDTAEKISTSAVKYSFLSTGIKNDMNFDLNESVSLSGDSGPYLLYTVSRIKSILEKAGDIKSNEVNIDNLKNISDSEKNLLIKLADFPEVAKNSAEDYDPSKIAKYLFDLAQVFSNFYSSCPVIKAEENEKEFRLELINLVEKVMTKGLFLLGMQTVNKM